MKLSTRQRLLISICGGLGTALGLAASAVAQNHVAGLLIGFSLAFQAVAIMTGRH